MRKIDLVPKLTPDSAQALWYELEAELDGAGGQPEVILDAKAVLHLSAAALQVLLVAQGRARRQGGSLTLANASDACVQALQTLGAQDQFGGAAA